LRSAFHFTPASRVPFGIARSRRRDSRNAGSSSGAAALAALGVGALAVALVGGSHWPGIDTDYQGAGIRTQPEREDVPSPSQLEATAKLAATLPLSGAVAFSSQCFDQARRSRSASAADLCIAFDTAFTYWQQGVGGRYPAEPYYQREAQNLRIEHALSSLDPDAAMVRAASIRASTFEALLGILDSEGALVTPNWAEGDWSAVTTGTRERNGDDTPAKRNSSEEVALSQKETKEP